MINMNEGGGAGVAFDFELQSSMIDGYSADLTETENTYEFDAGVVKLTSYEDYTKVEDGGKFIIDKAPVIEQLNLIMANSKFSDVNGNDYTGTINPELRGVSGDINFVYSRGWTRAALPTEFTVQAMNVYVEFGLYSDEDKPLQVELEHNPYADQFYDIPTSDNVFTNGLLIPATVKYIPSKDCIDAYNNLDSYDDEYDESIEIDKEVLEVLNAKDEFIDPDDPEGEKPMSCYDGCKFKHFKYGILTYRAEDDVFVDIDGDVYDSEFLDHDDLILLDSENEKHKSLPECTSKQQAISFIYNHVDSQGMFNDNWQKVYDIKKQIEDMGATCIISPTNSSHYTSGYPNDGSMREKCYDVNIQFTNNAGKLVYITGRLMCSGAGSVEQPLDLYDITLSLV